VGNLHGSPVPEKRREGKGGGKKKGEKKRRKEKEEEGSLDQPHNGHYFSRVIKSVQPRDEREGKKKKGYRKKKKKEGRRGGTFKPSKPLSVLDSHQPSIRREGK